MTASATKQLQESLLNLCCKKGTRIRFRGRVYELWKEVYPYTNVELRDISATDPYTIRTIPYETFISECELTANQSIHKLKNAKRGDVVMYKGSRYVLKHDVENHSYVHLNAGNGIIVMLSIKDFINGAILLDEKDKININDVAFGEMVV